MNMALTTDKEAGLHEKVESVNACRAEFEAKFMSLREEVYGFIDRRLNHTLRRRVDVSDVVQETQIVALQKYGAFLQNEPMPFRVWLLKTAKQQLIHLYRVHHVTKKRTVTKEIAWSDCSSMLMAKHIAYGVSPSENLRREEALSMMRQAIDKLPELDREILMMRHFENHAYEEIAILTDLHVDAIRQRCGRALIKLRMVMREMGLLEFQL